MNGRRARIRAFTRLSSAASRWLDARGRSALAPPGSPLAVARADAGTALDDARAAHTLAVDDVRPADLQPNGLLTVDAADRLFPGRRRASLARARLMMEDQW